MRIRDWSSDVCSSDLKWQSPLQAVDGLNIQPIETAGSIENKELRKREQPYLMPLNADTVRAVEKASYDGAYKGVTDILTLYLWRGAAFHLTRWAAALGMTPNAVTAIGAVLWGVATWR